MEFVRIENITSVYEMKETEADVHWIFNRFISSDEEVLYFVEDNFLKAVVSIGDLFQFLEGRRKRIWNTNFTALSEENEEDGETFFFQHPTVHELPVVGRDGKLTGMVKSGKSNSAHVRKSLRSYAKQLYYGLGTYYKKSVKRFMADFKGTVFLADLPNDVRVMHYLKSEYERSEFLRKREIEPLAQLKNMTEQEAARYWGDIYEPGIAGKFAKEFSEIDIVEEKGIKRFAGSGARRYITFDEGRRNVINKNRHAARKLYIAGSCTVFGSYVADNQTIEYYLQRLINEGGQSYQVVNFGSLGTGYEFQYLLTERLSDDDIVVILTQNKSLTTYMRKEQRARYIGDLSEIYKDIDCPTAYILDTFRHVNYKISEMIAGYLYSYIKPYISGYEKNIAANKYSPVQDYFISWDVVEYYKEFALKNNLCGISGKTGAVVMNCNPFTKGHRHLIEYASAKVDTLIIFVVEEDASFFSFDSRIAMVRAGVADLGNVRVVPSGRYNISKSTFAQYFEKDKQIESIESMEYDVIIFCGVTAGIMNISCRFAGEEPADVVTKQYNETMKEVLPEYGLEFVEIPRLAVDKDDKEYISASKARECIKNGNWNKLTNYLPDTTLDYLKSISLTEVCT